MNIPTITQVISQIRSRASKASPLFRRRALFRSMETYVTNLSIQKERPFFHELTDEEYEALKARCITYGELMETYQQPRWCIYPGALEGILGCWSLMYRYVKDEQYCVDCNCYQARQDTAVLTTRN